MTISSTAVKRTAKTALKGNFFAGMAVTAIYAFAWYACLIASQLLSSSLGAVFGNALFCILFITIILPLTFGMVFWSVRVIFTSSAQPILMFKYFSDKKEYFRAIRLIIPIAGNLIFTGIMLFVPSFIVDFLASGKLFTLLGGKIPLWVSGLWSVSAVLKAAAVIVLMLVSLKFYLTPFLLASDEDMDPLEAIHMSKTIATRSKWDFLWLILTFTGYIIACIFVVPIIFIFPYFLVSYAVFCRFSVAAYNKSVDKMKKPDTRVFEADMNF